MGLGLQDVQLGARVLVLATDDPQLVGRRRQLCVATAQLVARIADLFARASGHHVRTQPVTFGGHDHDPRVRAA